MTINSYERTKNDYNNGQSPEYLHPIVLFILGIIFILIGVLLNNSDKEFKKIAVTSTGTLSYERDFSKSTSDTDYFDVYVNYNVDGKDYKQYLRGEEESRSLTLPIKNGSKITIYYNPDNPSQVRDKKSFSFSPILIIFGAILVLLFMVDFIYRKVNGLKVGEAKLDDETTEKIRNFIDDLENDNGVSEKVQKVSSSIKSVICAIFGVILIIFGIYSLFSISSFNRNAKEINATVSKIEEVEKKDEDNKSYMDKEVYVKYEVEGKQYEKEVNINADGLSNGSIVKVYYDSRNPAIVNGSKEDIFGGFLALAIGIIFLIVPVLVKAT